MTQLLAKQHFLPSTAWLAANLRQRDEFSRMIFTGKHYSTIPNAINTISEYAEIAASATEAYKRLGTDRLIVLDEGGGLYKALTPPHADKAVIIEQTTFGLQSSWRCPTVLACRSAAKLLFESQIIARGIIRKLESLDLGLDHHFGVVGLGALGTALARALLRKGVAVSTFDISPPSSDLVSHMQHLPDLLRDADVILGCTGKNTLIHSDFNNLKGKKIFVSCSSEQIEFSTLLRSASNSGYDHIRGVTGSLEWTILNGGYPINFDRQQEWEKFDEIILTRQLMSEGVAQASSLFGARPTGYMMNPTVQYQLVMTWLDQVSNRSDLIVPHDLSEKFLRLHSEGEYIMSSQPYQLHSTTPDALAQMRAHKARYETEVLGLPIWVHPGVWSPAYDWSSQFYVENIGHTSDQSFLEIGSGTGVISVFAGRQGANPVVAVDANPAAVENTRHNFERHNLKNAAAILSEGFNGVCGHFDVIVWNAPYHGCKPSDDLERGCADEDYKGIKAFFRDAANHLKPGGRVIFGFSESGDMPLIEDLITTAGFQVVRKLSDWRQNYNCLLFDLKRSSLNHAAKPQECIL